MFHLLFYFVQSDIAVVVIFSSCPGIKYLQQNRRYDLIRHIHIYTFQGPFYTDSFLSMTLSVFPSLRQVIIICFLMQLCLQFRHLHYLHYYSTSIYTYNVPANFYYCFFLKLATFNYVTFLTLQYSAITLQHLCTKLGKVHLV